MLVSFKRHNRKWIQKINISQSTLPDGFFVDLRPLYNSHVAKVSVVIWSQKWIFVAGSVISGIAKYFQKMPFLM